MSSGGYVSYPSSARPSLEMRHFDGPLLRCRDGQRHFLTLWQTIRVNLGFDDALSLERKLRPDLPLANQVSR